MSHWIFLFSIKLSDNLSQKVSYLQKEMTMNHKRRILTVQYTNQTMERKRNSLEMNITHRNWNFRLLIVSNFVCDIILLDFVLLDIQCSTFICSFFGFWRRFHLCFYYTYNIRCESLYWKPFSVVIWFEICFARIFWNGFFVEGNVS